MEKRIITIDASGQILGRVASRVAALLIGKSATERKPNVVAPLEVVVYNAAQVKLSGKKADEKKYTHYSGYPGGLKREPYKKKAASDETFPLRNAIEGMIPRNRLRKPRMKQLTIYAHEKEN